MVAHFIDIGQANATLLEFQCGTVLIDAGTQLTATKESTDKLTAYLDEFFSRRTDLNKTINTIIITHNHKDHTGSLPKLQKKYTIKNIVTTTLNLGSNVRNVIKNEEGIKCDTIIDYSRVVDVLPNGVTSDIIDPLHCTNDPEITILSGRIERKPNGWSKGIFSNPNSHSLAIRVKFGASSFLFTGDMQEESINFMLDKYAAHLDALNVDVYEVGHHGSHNATTPELLNAMSPKIAVISSSHAEDHRRSTGFAFGHPNIKVVQSLDTSLSTNRAPLAEAAVFSEGWDEDSETNESMETVEVKKAIYCTCWDGTIKLSAKTDGTIKKIE